MQVGEWSLKIRQQVIQFHDAMYFDTIGCIHKALTNELFKV